MAYYPNVEQIIGAMQGMNYRIFKNPRGHDLNLVGIRTNDNTANTFNDYVTAFYLFDGQWNFFAFPATTDPGTFYRENPINVKGTAIMKPGQYRGAYKVGKHKGYTALQQKGNITVFRDNNRDRTLDTNGREDAGLHAVNIHRASRYRSSRRVDKWSAGCQVLQDPDHFDFLLALCKQGSQKYGNSFTYTLLEEGDL